jgi:hypothetical protein
MKNIENLFMEKWFITLHILLLSIVILWDFYGNLKQLLQGLTYDNFSITISSESILMNVLKSNYRLFYW